MSSFLGHPNRILDEAKNISFNATAAFKAYSNIKDYIDEAEKVTKEAKDLAQEATALVRNKSHIVLRTEVSLYEQVVSLKLSDISELRKILVNQNSCVELFLKASFACNQK